MQAQASLSPTLLVRLLADVATVPADASRQDFAEKIGQWLGAFDAVNLHAAHRSLKALAGDSPLGAAPHTPAALAAHFQRVRAALVAAVNDPVPQSANDSSTFALHRQHCQALQRDMALKIATLRAQVRHVLAHGVVPLRQLAELDAVWEQMLSSREQKCLSGVTTLLEKRFVQLHAIGQSDRYVAEQQAVLLAELNARLLPVAGLVEAFAQQANRNKSQE